MNAPTIDTPLIGREAAVARLIALLSHGDAPVVVLSGEAGAGKTRLAAAAAHALRARKTLVGTGQFYEGVVGGALQPVMDALSQLTDRALEELYDPQAGIVHMTDTLGVDLEILVQAGFRGGAVSRTRELSSLIGRRQGQARVVQACVRLLRWLAGFGCPLLLVLDDWWRAAPDARRLVHALGREPLDVRLAQLRLVRSGGAHVASDDDARIERLAPLGCDDARRLMAAVLRDDADATAMAAWFGDDAPRLPLEIIEAARALREGDAFTSTDGAAGVDYERAAALGSPSLMEGVARRVRALSAEARDLAAAVAIWSEAPSPEGLMSALALEPLQYAGAVLELGAAGLISVEPGAAPRIRHDRLREAVLRQRGDISELAARMSERLASGVAGAVVDDAALKLRVIAGVTQAHPQTWRDRFAAGARAARRRADADQSAHLAEIAWDLRVRGGPGERAADRAMLHEAVLSAADRRSLEDVRARVSLLLEASRGDVELGDAYATAIVCTHAAGGMDAAWAFAEEGLKRFGVRPPRRATRSDVLVALLLWKAGHVRPRPEMRRSPLSGLAKLGEAASTLAFERSPSEAALVALRASAQARRSQDGSAFWCSVDAFLHSLTGDYEAAANAGAEAMSRLRPNGPSRAATMYRALYFGVIWRRSAGDLQTQCGVIQQAAVAEGDLAVAGNAARNSVTLAWRSATTLGSVINIAAGAVRDLERLGETRLASEGPWPVVSRIGEVEDIAAVAEALADPASSVAYRPRSPLLALQLANLRGDWAAAALEADAQRRHRLDFDSHPGGVDWRFHECLCRAKTGLRLRRRDRLFLRRHARLNPTDHAAKPLVVEAEELRRQGRAAACLSAYASAVEAAQACPSRIEAGLAARCASDDAAQFGDEEAAPRFQAAADAIWRAWGAHALVRPDAAPALGDEAMSARLLEAEAEAISARRADEAKSRFLHHVVHELRTPLQGMESLLDLARAGVRPFELAAFEAAFQGVKAAADDLAAMQESPSATVGPGEAFDLQTLVRSEIEPFLSADVEVAVDIEGARTQLRSDVRRVRQVLRNLLRNAVKYGGGELRVSASAEPSGDGAMSVRLTVEDRGPGLHPPDLPRLFEPFFRSVWEQHGDGQGLGLALSRQIARRLGGDLTAANRSHGGARFDFSFPATVDLKRDVRSSPASAPRLRILLAEDEPLTRRALVELLRAGGHEVTQVADGPSALKAACDQAHDLLLLDVHLPGMTGLDVLRGVREGNGPSKATPALLLTASSDPLLEAQARRLSGARLLRKPVSAEVLAAAFENTGAASGALKMDPPTPQEVDEQIEALIRRIESSLFQQRILDAADDAHKLSGLAAQFDRIDVCIAAERLESMIRTGDQEYLYLCNLKNTSRSGGSSRTHPLPTPYEDRKDQSQGPDLTVAQDAAWVPCVASPTSTTAASHQTTNQT